MNLKPILLPTFSTSLGCLLSFGLISCTQSPPGAELDPRWEATEKRLEALSAAVDQRASPERVGELEVKVKALSAEVHELRQQVVSLQTGSPSTEGPKSSEAAEAPERVETRAEASASPYPPPSVMNIEPNPAPAPQLAPATPTTLVPAGNTFVEDPSATGGSIVDPARR